MPRRVRPLLISLSILAIAALVVDQLTLTRPRMPGPREGDPSPARPQPSDLPFSRTPIAPSFEDRRSLYLAWLLEQTPPADRGGVWTDSARLLAGAPAITQSALNDGLDFVNARKDPSDFTVTGLVRLLYLHGGTGKLTSEQEEAIRSALLNFKYWLDEPGLTYVEAWTENHQILDFSSEYLVGQIFPDEVFSNSNLTGREHMQKARARILRWIDWHARTGFAEWDSVVYYAEDLAALLNLVDFAEDREIVQKSTLLVDLLLFDIAVDSYYGQYATSHGRATANSIKSASGDGLVTLQALAWGLGRWQSISNMAAIALATSPRYQIPPVIQSIAVNQPQAMTNYERHSIPLSQQAADQYGLSFDNPSDLPIWWGMGAFTNPPVIANTIAAVDRWDLWHYPDFRALKDLAKVLQATGTLKLASSLLDPESNGVLMSEVNKVTYRTPDYVLSSAQDYRKGEKGYQQHIWQATLDPYAVVFVTNPDSLRADDKHRPSYWSSSGRLPRTAQHQNVLISLFNISRRPSLPPLESRHYAFTHAYFPRWAFDRITETSANGPGSWIIGQKGSGYVALYSYQPMQPTTTGPDANQEVIALGRQNVWIVQMGRAEVDGSFEEFAAAIASAPVSVSGLAVIYSAPGGGEYSFGWDDPFTVDGKPIPLNGYPRWENPYAQVAFNSTKFVIRHNGSSLSLDVTNGERIIK